MRRCARAASDAGGDGRAEQIRFFALHRARDDYGRQARDEGDQHEEQVKCGRAVVFFYMNHGFAIAKRSTCEDARVVSSGRASSWFSLSGLSWRPVRSSHFVAPRVGLFPARGPRAHRVAPQTSNRTLGVCTRVNSRVATPCQCRNLRPSRGSDQLVCSPVVLFAKLETSNEPH